MATRNFGVGTRCMSAAGRIILNQAVDRGDISFATAHSVDHCWGRFTEFARDRGVRRIEHVRPALVQAYGSELAVRVRQGDCESGYAQRLVSAVNTVLRLSGANWQPVKPVSDCGIPCRTHIRQRSPGGMDAGHIAQLVTALQESDMPRAAGVVQLAWGFGLRSKECALLDAVKALKSACRAGQFELAAGTKGGRRRIAQVRQPHQIEILKAVAQLQGAGRSIMPTEMDWRQFRDSELLNARPVLKCHGIRHFHDLRAAYACRRYHEMTGHPAPVFGGGVIDKAKDRAARLTISQELGHNRIEVSAAYVGGLS